MRFIFYNIVPLALIILAGLMIYWNKHHYGWLILLAALLAVTPKYDKK